VAAGKRGDGRWRTNKDSQDLENLHYEWRRQLDVQRVGSFVLLLSSLVLLIVEAQRNIVQVVRVE